MTSSQRLALLLAAAALLVGGFFVARGSDEDTVTTAPGTPAVTSATAPDPASTPSTGTQAPAPATTSTTAPPPAPAVPAVVVEGGKPRGGVQDLTFKKGQTAAFTVRSDIADEIHVHGYDLVKDVKAGGRVSFSFKAKIDGIFEVELENAGVQIASLKVTP